MSLVGPRPEDPAIVERDPDLFAEVMTVRPGITGLSQLAFAKEAEILDPTDRMGHYRRRILPQKLALDGVYVTHRTLWKDIKILMWTAAAFIDVGVHRGTGVLRRRRRNAMETPPPQPNGRPRLRAVPDAGQDPALAGMHVVILAGGRPASERDSGSLLPEPLMPIGDRSILETIIAELDSLGGA